MKLSNRLLALLLALALALTLALPAIAEEETPPPEIAAQEIVAQAVNWDDFYIITQPQDQAIRNGQSFTLSVAVNIPAGVEVEYQWSYRASNGRSAEIENATGPVLQVSPGDECYPDPRGYGALNRLYSCKIIGYEKDGDEIIAQKMLDSGAYVKVKETILQFLFSLFVTSFTMTILVGSLAALFMVFITAGLALPFVPIMYLIAYIRFFLDTFSAYFK